MKTVPNFLVFFLGIISWIGALPFDRECINIDGGGLKKNQGIGGASPHYGEGGGEVGSKKLRDKGVERGVPPTMGNPDIYDLT